jgi:transglutaminase-like putative cysteine protease
MPFYSVKHTTHYKYLYPVSVSHHATFLQPLNLPWQRCSEFSLTTDPACHDYRTRKDYFGNVLGLFSIQEEHQSLVITSESRVEVFKQAPDVNAFPVTCGQAREVFQSSGSVPLEALQYLFGSNRINPDPVDAIREYARSIFLPGKPLLVACQDLMQDIRQNFVFDAEATDVNTSVEDFMSLRRGVCQDFTHFAITLLTAMDLPARYVSGYILTNPPPGKPRLEGADASHAWASVYVPEHGWVDFDPTNHIFCADQHITVAYGRDFEDVSLVRGAVTGGGEHELEVEVTVKPCE